MSIRLLVVSLLLLLLGCEVPMAEVRELPEPPTLEVPVMVKAAVDEDWVSLRPSTGFNIYVGAPTEFTISGGVKESLDLRYRIFSGHLRSKQ